MHIDPIVLIRALECADSATGMSALHTKPRFIRPLYPTFSINRQHANDGLNRTATIDRDRRISTDDTVQPGGGEKRSHDIGQKHTEDAVGAHRKS
ncbi:MAG: hypothetical protein E6Q88_03885 [Lysobacteraceae bacterium]|nr:MAG: hypothetical protein E6Q88_03885 [Xanthomonadaceae bacterium]